ncbi:hypothetical protein E0K83_12265 [Gramella sp. BOM4]|nr:hypothetical protein [Christiangramia bathymodioli]
MNKYFKLLFLIIIPMALISCEKEELPQEIDSNSETVKVDSLSSEKADDASGGEEGDIDDKKNP